MALFNHYATSALRSNGEGAEVRRLVPDIHAAPKAKFTTLQLLADARRLQRELANAADETSALEFSVAQLWRELTHGLCKVVDCYFSVQRCLVLAAPTIGANPALDAKRLRILEEVLTCGAQKVVAIEMEVSPSTVAANAQRALELIGVPCKPSRPHPLLMLAARAHRELDSSVSGRLSFVNRGAATTRVISIARPERHLADFLSPAEFTITRGLVEGDCYAEIARQR